MGVAQLRMETEKEEEELEKLKTGGPEVRHVLLCLRAMLLVPVSFKIVEKFVNQVTPALYVVWGLSVTWFTKPLKTCVHVRVPVQLSGSAGQERAGQKKKHAPTRRRGKTVKKAAGAAADGAAAHPEPVRPPSPRPSPLLSSLEFCSKVVLL